MSLLKIEGLCKYFWGVIGVQNLDFEVQQGEIVGLIGPNGSGKTTTLNLMTGFLKPDSGRITFKGEDVTGLPRCRVCQQGVARTFQLIKPFLDFTALQNVMVGRAYGQEPARNLKVAAAESEELLDWVGLLDKAKILAKDLQEHHKTMPHAGLALVARANHQPQQTAFHICQILEGAKALSSHYLIYFTLPFVALLLVDHGKERRAIEVYSLARQYPFVRNSKWLDDLVGQEIRQVEANLAPEIVEDC